MTDGAQPTREALVFATIQEIEAVGLGRITVRAIAARAQANVAAVSYHFGSKEALVTAALESTRAHTIADARAILAGRATAELALSGAPIPPGPDSELDAHGAQAALRELMTYLLTGAARNPRVMKAHLERAGASFADAAFARDFRALLPSMAALLRRGVPDLSKRAAQQRAEVALMAVLFAALYPGFLVAASPAGRRRVVQEVMAALTRPPANGEPIRHPRRRP